MEMEKMNTRQQQDNKRIAVLVIQHAFHPDHVLYFSNPPALPNFRCNGCNQQGQGFRYRCEECNVDLHGACAVSDPNPPPGTWRVIHHPLHVHPLILTNETYNTFRCNCCGNPGGGARFHCSLCGFDMHEACALPARYSAPKSRNVEGKPPGCVIHHPIHCHPLRLSNETYDTFLCNICGQRGQGKRFQCTWCRFDLHDACASVHCNGVAAPLPAAGHEFQERGIGTTPQFTNVLGGIVRNALMHVFGQTVIDMILGGNGVNLDFNFFDFDYGSFDFFYLW